MPTDVDRFRLRMLAVVGMWYRLSLNMERMNALPWVQSTFLQPARANKNLDLVVFMSGNLLTG